MKFLNSNKPHFARSSLQCNVSVNGSSQVFSTKWEWMLVLCHWWNICIWYLVNLHSHLNVDYKLKLKTNAEKWKTSDNISQYSLQLKHQGSWKLFPVTKDLAMHISMLPLTIVCRAPFTLYVTLQFSRESGPLSQKFQSIYCIKWCFQSRKNVFE